MNGNGLAAMRLEGPRNRLERLREAREMTRTDWMRKGKASTGTEPPRLARDPHCLEGQRWSKEVKGAATERRSADLKTKIN